MGRGAEPNSRTRPWASSAGTQYLFAEPPAWVAPGRPFIRGRVVHETDEGSRFYLTVFSWEQGDVDVVAVDGLFFAIRKSLFSHVPFDREAVFDGFHFYDIDICMQVRRTHRIVVTPDISVKHPIGREVRGGMAALRRPLLAEMGGLRGLQGKLRVRRP